MQEVASNYKQKANGKGSHKQDLSHHLFNSPVQLSSEEREEITGKQWAVADQPAAARGFLYGHPRINTTEGGKNKNQP